MGSEREAGDRIIQDDANLFHDRLAVTQEFPRTDASGGLPVTGVTSRRKGGLAGRLARFFSDLAVLNVLFHLVLGLRFGSLFPASSERLHGAPWSIYPELEFFMNVLWVVIALTLKLYRPRETRQQWTTNLDEIRLIARAGVLLAASLLVCIALRGGYNFYSRLFLGEFLVALPVVLVAVRILALSTAASVRRQNAPRKNVIVVGAGAPAERFYRTVVDHPEYGYRVLGFLDESGAAQSRLRPMVLGTLRDLDRVASRSTVDEIILALPEASEAMINAIVTECEKRCIRVALISSDAPIRDRPRTIEQIGDVALMRMREAPLDQWANRVIKRTFDIAFSLFVLVVIFPIIFAASALAIKLTSRGPIFFRQDRTGEDGRTFLCYKFRTMRLDHVSEHVLQATHDDPRSTPFGRWLRRTSLDELPQFWNVLKGEMSVVGPRPHMLKHTEDYRNTISQYMVRHFVKPGLTGWAQIHGYRGATHDQEAMQRRIEHDLYYVEHWSFLLDLTIIARTVVRILLGDANAY